MRMQAGETDIFGAVAQGVPSPYVPHIHPYPTRFHGPIFTQPQFGRPYRANPYTVAPYAGTDGLGRCACSGIQSLGNLSPDGVGVYEGPPLFGQMTGSVIGDAAIGGAIAYFVAPPGSEKGFWAGIGAALAGAGGTLGLVGIIGAAFWARGKRG